MIISDSFVKSQKARDNEFTTNSGNHMVSIDSHMYIKHRDPKLLRLRQTLDIIHSVQQIVEKKYEL